jgi:hypothetical protein
MKSIGLLVLISISLLASFLVFFVILINNGEVASKAIGSGVLLTWMCYMVAKE